ncbi:hypothetical protein [Thermocrinis minervae]|uniref:Uncharacterized protein n=1 Tax=Thermocrinis minervae TaxID=381751 RepID=A0A1M6SMS6_9AQUI|nr:hypothetical protein [Thermocrinis minervae]SHK46084.1 hypothetical protein SAMN05444391_1092 [Thermocrinis minervae]
MERKEDIRPESMEEIAQELRNSIYRLFDLFLPPKELREEVKKNLYMAELYLLKSIKAIIDYKVSSIEKRVEGKEKQKEKERSKRIQVE